MSEQHTPEPWKQGTTLATTQTRQWTTERIEENDRRERRMVFSSFSPIDGGRGRRLVAICEHDEDARRIVACVNACAGMADPESELARLRRINENLVEALVDVSKTTEEMARQRKQSEGADGDFEYAYDWFCDESRGVNERIRQALAAAKEE